MRRLLSIVEKLKRKKYVEAILQFGSSLEGRDFRDIDLCIFTARPLSLKNRLVLLRDIPEKYDVSFYEDLPLHIKREVLTKGKILFTKDYYKIIKEILRVDLEYPRYQAFIKEYHKEMMATV